MRKYLCPFAVPMLFSLMSFMVSCNKPFVEARVSPQMETVSRSFSANANDAYYAVRHAFESAGYAVASENLTDGIIISSWRAVSASSHYLDMFNRKDYTVTGAYHQIEVHIIPDGGKTKVQVSSRTKSLVAHLRSSGREERKILDGVGDALRTAEPTITNLGIEE